MKTKKILASLLLTSTLTFGQHYNWHNNLVMSGSNNSSITHTDAIDYGLGQLLTVGRFAGTIDLDPSGGTSTHTSLGSDLYTNNDWFIQKTDGAGNVLYTRILEMSDATSQVEVVDAKILENGSVILLGTLVGSINSVGGTTSQQVSTPEEDGAMIVLNYNPSGVLYYSKVFQASQYDLNPINLTIRNNDVEIWAELSTSSDIDPSPTAEQIVSNLSIVKIELQSNGSFSDYATIAYPGQTNQVILNEDFQNSYYAIIGNFGMQTTFDPAVGIQVPIPNKMNKFYWVLDNNLNYVTHGLSVQNYGISEMRAEFAQGKLILGGGFQDSIDFDLSTPEYDMNTANYAGYLYAIDVETKQMIWSKQYSNLTTLMQNSMSASPEENAFYLLMPCFTGQDASGNGTDIVASPLVVLAKHELSTGNYLGKMTLPYGMTSTRLLIYYTQEDMNVLISGTTANTTDIDPSANVANSTASSSFYAKYSTLAPTNSLVENELQASVFPNPATSQFTVQGLTKNASYRLLTVSGEEVQRGTIEGNKQLSVTNLANGIYFLHIATDSKQGTVKFVVRH